MRLIDADRLENNLSCSCMGFGTGVFNIIRNCETIRPETLPIVQELRAEIERLNRGIENLSKNVESAYKQRDELRAELEKVKAERDAAIKELHGKCSVCKSYAPFHRQDKCLNCKWDNASPACLIEYQEDNWEWHGVKDENNS